MVASDTSGHNFFRRLIWPRTTVARTCFYPITGAARERRGRFDALSRRITPPLHAGGVTESEFSPTRSVKVLCAELAINGPFALVGEPIAAVNWRKGDAAQQRKLKNPQCSTAMALLVGTTAATNQTSPANCSTRFKASWPQNSLSRVDRNVRRFGWIKMSASAPGMIRRWTVGLVVW
jgi:hypothetical protein